MGEGTDHPTKHNALSLSSSPNRGVTLCRGGRLLGIVFQCQRRGKHGVEGLLKGLLPARRHSAQSISRAPNVVINRKRRANFEPPRELDGSKSTHRVPPVTPRPSRQSGHRISELKTNLGQKCRSAAVVIIVREFRAFCPPGGTKCRPRVVDQRSTGLASTVLSLSSTLEPVLGILGDLSLVERKES